MQVVDTVITSILILTILFIVFKTIGLFIENNELHKKVLQSEIDKFIFIDKLQKDLPIQDTNVEDGFLKFITESREQAFSYIEDSQKTIKDFLSFLDKNIEYLKVNQKRDAQYRVIIKDLEDYSQKLKELLPKEE